MKILKFFFVIVIVLSTGFPSSVKGKNKTELFKKENIKSIMVKVCDWQINNLPDSSWLASENKWVPIESNGWIRSAFLTGVMAAYRITKKDGYLSFAKSWGGKNSWELAEKKRHADDQCCLQTYAELYEIYKDPKMIEASKNNFDEIAANPMRGPESGWNKNLNWSWCDALFMAPPALARLSETANEKKYLALMDTMFLDTYRFLYDDEYDLFFRDSSYKREAEPLVRSKIGKPVFWSRGNGWVLAGLARVLQYLPNSYANREFYFNLFKKMSASVIKHQGEDGFWHSSLLDTESYPEPESSGTGFFCFALAWGINEGILDKENYLPAVKKAWTALYKCVDENGKLHWVQHVGSKPGQVKYEDSVEYGVGAFLLAASEIYKLSK